MLNGMANDEVKVNGGGITNFTRKKKGGISVQQLGYNVIFNGG